MKMRNGMKTGMRRRVQKVFAVMLACTLLFGMLAVTTTAPTYADAPLFTIEGEDAELSPELQVVNQIYGQPKPGYSGSGFVWMQGSGTITLNVTVPETGMYSISTRYMQELSMDGRLQYLAVNGMTKGSYIFALHNDMVGL